MLVTVNLSDISDCHRVVFTAAPAVVASTMDMGWDFMPEAEEMKSAFKSGGVEECRTLMERKRDEWKQIPLNVAVIGNSGVGKSSFINAIRRLTADDEGGAPVGVQETTLDIQDYSHPSNPLLKFWDLPGVGTDRFPRHTYLSAVQVDRFDFFLLITADRFTENDTWLGEEFRKRNKKYFFVHTKVGADMSNNKKAHPKTHNENDVVKFIRESTQEHLNERGCKDVPVFLIDSYKLKKFDFEFLESRLIEDFPKLKKAALVLSLQATSKEMIQLKVAELRSRMWKLAALSGLVAAIPLPGLSLSMDIGIVSKEAGFYHTQLGLDETSLKRYAKLTNTDYQQMKSIVDRCLGCKVLGVEGIRKIVEELSKRAAPLLTSAAVEEGSRFIPMIGSFIAAPLSFGGTYYALKLVLDKMESVAMEVVEFAAKTATGTEESDDSDVD